MERDHIKTVSNPFVMDSLKYVTLCAKPNICFTVEIMSGY